MIATIDVRAEIDAMMYQYVQTEIDLPAFEAWFMERWPAVERGALARLCEIFERDEIAWQDMAEAFASLVRTYVVAGQPQ